MKDEHDVPGNAIEAHTISQEFREEAEEYGACEHCPEGQTRASIYEVELLDWEPAGGGDHEVEMCDACLDQLIEKARIAETGGTVRLVNCRKRPLSEDLSVEMAWGKLDFVEVGHE